jgi:diamine N-acetyltransferase
MTQNPSQYKCRLFTLSYLLFLNYPLLIVVLHQYTFDMQSDLLSFDILKVSLVDLHQVRSLSIKTFTEAFEKDNTAENLFIFLDKHFNTEKLTRELNNPESFWFVVVVADEMVGYLKLNVGSTQTEYQSETDIEIERIYVLQAFVGKGLGAALMQVGLDFAKTAGKSAIWLGVWEHNVKAIRFYEKHGFEVFDKHIFWVGDDPQQDLILRRLVVG